jgi:16S rRNA (adenine1518-N6/adenine1519-N6)-dimethyltransferase
MRWDFPYDSPNAITALLDRAGFSMSKRFGQNFLLSTAVREHIVDMLGPIEGKQVWEVGPGLGALTIVLLERQAQVTAYEIDHGFCRILRAEAFLDEANLTLVEGDALKTWEGVFAAQGVPFAICGNLPYNVGSICIARFLEKQCLPQRMVFTLQKEVAERLCSVPGDKHWSAFSILTQVDYQMEVLFNINPGAFYPVPTVISTVIGMTRREKPLVDPSIRETFFEVVHDLFAQRRKTVKNNLLHGKTGSRIGRDGIVQALAASGIPQEERAEQLGIDQLLTLTTHILANGNSSLGSAFP